MLGSDIQHLFSSKDLGALIRAYEPAMREEVEKWDRNRILASSESDLIQFLVEKYLLHSPSLRRDEMHIESEGETPIDISGRFDYGYLTP